MSMTPAELQAWQSSNTAKLLTDERAMASIARRLENGEIPLHSNPSTPVGPDGIGDDAVKQSLRRRVDNGEIPFYSSAAWTSSPEADVAMASIRRRIAAQDPEMMAAMAAGEPVDGVTTADMSTNCINMPQIVPTTMNTNDFATWQTNALMLGVIAAVLVEFGCGKNRSVNRKNIAIMAAVVAGALEIWLISVFYKNRRTTAYWFMFVCLLIVLAVFVYLAVVAGQR